MRPAVKFGGLRATQNYTIIFSFFFFSKESTNYRSKNSINKGEHSWLTSRVNLNIRSFSYYNFCN